MNKPVHPVVSPEGGSPAYEADAYGWALAQAAFIRSGRLDQIDWTNVAEEIEDVAKIERRAAESALRLIMMHILKWQMQPERQSRSWAGSIATQRAAYDQALAENPSLRSHVDAMRSSAYRRSRIEAAAEMDMPIRLIGEQPLDWATILDAPFEVD